MYKLELFRKENPEWLNSQLQCNEPSVEELVRKLEIDQDIARVLAKDFSVRIEEVNNGSEMLKLKIEDKGENETEIELAVVSDKDKVRSIVYSIVSNVTIGIVGYVEVLKMIVESFGNELDLPRCELVDPGHRYILVYGNCEIKW